jgi:hypothetical protein
VFRKKNHSRFSVCVVNVCSNKHSQDACVQPVLAASLLTLAVPKFLFPSCQSSTCGLKDYEYELLVLIKIVTFHRFMHKDNYLPYNLLFNLLVNWLAG